MRLARVRVKAGPAPLAAGGGERLPAWVLPGLRACAAALAFAAPAPADPPAWVPNPPQPEERAVHDLQLTLRARNALLQDPALARQQVGVSVHNRVATLWGRVATWALARRAEACLHQVFGLTVIRNELHVEAPEGLERHGTLPSLGQRAPLAEPVLPPPQPTQDAVVHHPSEPALIQEQEFLGRPTEGKPTAAALAPGQLAGARRGPPPALLPPLTEAEADSGLAQKVNALCLADGRYYRVRAEVVGGTVYLGGFVDRWEHLFELAQAIARLPGAKRVVLDDVRTSRQ